MVDSGNKELSDIEFFNRENFHLWNFKCVQYSWESEEFRVPRVWKKGALGLQMPIRGHEQK
jgi:hypothetical protein